MKKLKFGVLILAMLLLAACQGAQQTDGVKSPAPQENTKISEETPENTEIQRDPDRKTIDTIQLSMTVESVEDTEEKLLKLTEEHNGILESSQKLQQGNSYENGNYRIKIPRDQNDSFYNALKPFGKITSETKGSDDVTVPHQNTEIRMNSLKAQHERLLELLDQAESMEDIIALESKISENITQQEELQARLDHLNSQIDYVSYTLNLREHIREAPEVEGGFFSKVILALQSTGVWFINVLQFLVIALIYLLPYILVGLVIAYLYRRYRKKHPKTYTEHKGTSFGKWKKKDSLGTEKEKQDPPEDKKL